MQLSDNSGTLTLPGFAGRTKLVFKNTSSITGYWGWESTVSAGGGANQGIPIAANAAVILDGAETGLTEPIYFAYAAGSTFSINYTQK